jgi:hypothetical protein
MRRTLLAVSVALSAVALVFVGGKAFGFSALSLSNPSVGITMDVEQILPDVVPGTTGEDLFVVKVLCGALGTLGGGQYRTEINIYNPADLALSPIIVQVVSTGAFTTTGGTVSANVAKTINARSAIRMECRDITSRVGSPVIGFVRIQPPATGPRISVTAVWTRTF